MITQQPSHIFELKNVSLTDKVFLENIIHTHLPYSDYNFTNLWSWDVLGSRQFSELYGNLVVLFTDYRTHEPVLSFLGTKSVVETAETLLSYAEYKNLEPVLRFITEPTAQALTNSAFCVTEDPANHDYIFSVKDIAFPEGKKMKSKRRLANTFALNNPHITTSRQLLTDPATQQQMLAVLYCWEQNKQLNNKSYEIIYEEIALRRLLGSASDQDQILTCLYDGDTMIGFSIDEILPNQYALSHFIKADVRYRGIYEFLNQMVATDLLEQGVLYWNWEQDLNLEGLRMLKNSYQPIQFLKKYTISRNS